MEKEEIKREVKKLIKKCIYLDKIDFIDAIYSHFEKIGVYDYKSIDNVISELQQYIIFKN